MKVVHEKLTPFECLLCNSKFGQRSSLTIHIETVHEKSKPFECNLCVSKFGQRQNLIRHVKIVHEKVKPFECNICDSKFGEKRGLIFHISTVHEKVKPFKCYLCDSKFVQKRNQTTHVRTVHEKIKPFECNLCNSQFGQKGSLIRHLKVVHDKIKPECTPCFLKFGKIDCQLLHMHMECSTKLKIQTNIIKSKETINIALPQVQDIKSQPKEDDVLEQLCLYECDICEKILSNAKTLEAHFKQIHKSNLAFGCNTCSDRYPRADLLNQHKLCCSKLYDDIKLPN